MHRRPIAALGSALILVPALIWSRGDRPSELPAKTKLPKAFGAIQPRLSPDGSTVAFSYQGEIWTGPRAGGTMTLLTPSLGLDTEPAWSPDGKRVAFLRGGGVKVVHFPDGPAAHPQPPGGVNCGTKRELCVRAATYTFRAELCQRRGTYGDRRGGYRGRADRRIIRSASEGTRSGH